MTKITHYLKPHVPKMTLGLLIKLTGSVVDLFIPWILAYMIDSIVPIKSVPLILIWGGVMIACSLAAVITNIIANRMASKVARDITKTLRHDLFRKISYLSCAQVDDYTTSSLVSRLTSDTYNIHQTIGMMQRLGVRAPILLIGGIVITLILDPVLALVLIAVLPLITGVVYVVSVKGIPLYNNLQKSVDQMVRTIRENIAGVRVIKALSKTEYEKGRFSQVNAQVVDKEKKAGITMAITNPMMNVFLNVGLTLVIVVGANRVNSGLTQPGVIIAFLTYFTIILNAMLSITRIFILLSKGTASFKRIAQILDTPEDMVIGEEDIVPTDDHINFDHVSFSYHKNQNNLTDIHFSLKQGETLGIIGTTGSGKSSIIKLLLRFYNVDTGCIRIHGKNINSIPEEVLHTMFGIVFQNDVLFADSIVENIDFGRDLDPVDMALTTQYAQAGEFIESLSEGWDHELTVKGSNLSGGQKQRILISRALAGNPEILVLDDSSSALDYKTDALLRKSLSQNFQQTTTIIIAQRISSIRRADYIMVLDDGKVIGYGKHDDLLRHCPSYQTMSALQMGGYDDEQK